MESGGIAQRAKAEGRKNWKRVLSVFCVLALFAAGLHYSNGLLVNKQSLQKYGQFFETDKSFDVLFLGSSHVINGVSPLDLYQNYGITSFNLAMHGNYVKSGYYLLAQSLEILERDGRELPKAVVLDVFSDGEGVSQLHNAWDGFPASKVKMEMAKNLAGGRSAEFLAPFSLYHGRWNELGKNDFKPEMNQLYGVELRYGVSLPEQEIITDAGDAEDIGEEKLCYVNRIKELCEARGIRLVLIHIPYSYTPQWQREANSFYGYAKENGLCYVNYMNEDTGIDFDIDFYDAGHLNPAGMRKMTNELGKLLRELGLEDGRGKKEYRQWKEEYKEYIQYRIDKLKGVKEGKIYLMSLQDPDLVSVVLIKRSAMENVQIRKLAERLDDGENRVLMVEDGEEFWAFDDKGGTFDIYCTVYEKGDLSQPVDEAGFGEHRWEKR